MNMEEMRKNFVIGAINTVIRSVNDLCEKEVINFEWQSVTMTDGEFQAYLTVNDTERMLAFPKEYWLTSSDYKEVYKKVIELEIELTSHIQ